MALASALDDDDEYGWDLSLEDEQLLSSLADQAITLNNQGSMSPGSAGSDTTITTDLRPSPARQPHRQPLSSLKADIHAAFPHSPRNETIADLDSIPDSASASLNTGFGYCGFSQDAGSASAWAKGGAQRVGSIRSIPPLLDESATASTFAVEDIRYPDLNAALSSADPPVLEGPEPEPEPEVNRPTRSPLARFRTFPKKPLSVTDFVSGVWCELQHEFTLTYLPGGRKTRNAAMKGGSRVHKQLEDEVHKTVRIDIMSKEDAFGLKLWNIIQGLRTLRDDGLTRELEVWGLVDGHVVNGLIDGLSTQHPDPEFEEEILSRQGSQNASSQESNNQNQRITDYFAATEKCSDTSSGMKTRTHTQTRNPPRKVWLTDVKTRGHFSLPNKAALRPATIQLFMYHRFLSQMAACNLDYLHIFRRYGLDPDELFSDTFLAQIGALYDELFEDATSEPTSPSSPSKTTTGSSSSTAPSSSASDTNEHVRYRSLRSLIPLLQAEMRLTFPEGAASLGQVVSVEYRYRGRFGGEEDGGPDVGRVIGDQRLHVDDGKLQNWLERHMEWWRGERPADGVPIEEADKCRICEFADRCGWREENHRKLVALAREKKTAAAAVGGKDKDRGWRKYV